MVYSELLETFYKGSIQANVSGIKKINFSVIP